MEFCDFLTKIRFSSTNVRYHKIVEIDDLMYVSNDILTKLNDKILQQPNLRNLKYLDARGIYDTYNTDINAYDFYSNISQEGINGLNLIHLNTSNNKKINNVSHMKNLKILNANGLYCGIDQFGIHGLDLTTLCVDSNHEINDVGFMKNLRILHVNYNNNIDQNNIKDLNLEELSMNYNFKINDVSHMTNLKRLYVVGKVIHHFIDYNSDSITTWLHIDTDEIVMLQINGERLTDIDFTREFIGDEDQAGFVCTFN